MLHLARGKSALSCSISHTTLDHFQGAPLIISIFRCAGSTQNIGEHIGLHREFGLYKQDNRSSSGELSGQARNFELPQSTGCSRLAGNQQVLAYKEALGRLFKVPGACNSLCWP